jgi:flavin reductase ActVB
VVFQLVDTHVFRDAMARFATGVTVVATVDREGRPWGFTASAFTALSLDPPMVLVCLAASADSHHAFVQADRYAIHILRAEQEDLAHRFARKGTDKFAGSGGDVAQDGLPSLPDVLARLVCSVHALYQGGDHTILVGLVQQARVGAGRPMIHFDRRFWSLPGSGTAPARAVRPRATTTPRAAT